MSLKIASQNMFLFFKKIDKNSGYSFFFPKQKTRDIIYGLVVRIDNY